MFLPIIVTDNRVNYLFGSWDVATPPTMASVRTQLRNFFANVNFR